VIAGSASVALLLGAVFATASGHAQVLKSAQGDSDPLPPDEAIVARVDGTPISFREVKQQLAGALQGRDVPDAALPMALAQSLEQVIARQLITAEMVRRDMRPTPEETKAAEENFQKNLTRRGITRDEYLKQNMLNEADLEKVRYWEICWNRFARELLTDDHLKQFFDAHHRDYDGTQLRVSHILLRIEGTQDQGTVQAALKKAAAIREELTSGRAIFADEALRHSAGPSREQGGDLGFIPRRERMVEEFSAAAFRLKKGEISPPVLTPFGVHLITVTDEQPGTVKWQDVREQLITAAQLPLFRQLATQLRPRAKMEYTGLLPLPPAMQGRQ
jgi:parvulin-like peptidyl-prolyl isomerase